MDNRKIGVFLQTLRKEKGLTQQELADYFEVSSKTVSKWECGSALPEITMLKAISEYYGIKVDEILSGERETEHKNNSQDFNYSREINEKYFFDKNVKHLNLFMIIFYSTLTLGYLFLYFIGYTLSRSDIGCWVSIGFYFISLVLMIIGVFTSKKLDEDFSSEILEKYRLKRIDTVYHFMFAFVFCLISSIVFYAVPVKEIGSINFHIKFELFFPLSIAFFLIMLSIDVLTYKAFIKKNLNMNVKLIGSYHYIVHFVEMIIAILAFCFILFADYFFIINYESFSNGILGSARFDFFDFCFEMKYTFLIFISLAFLAVVIVLNVIKLIKKKNENLISTLFLFASCVLLDTSMLLMIDDYQYMKKIAESKFSNINRLVFYTSDNQTIFIVLTIIVTVLLIFNIILMLFKKHKTKKMSK